MSPGTLIFRDGGWGGATPTSPPPGTDMRMRNVVPDIFMNQRGCGALTGWMGLKSPQKAGCLPRREEGSEM